MHKIRVLLDVGIGFTVSFEKSGVVDGGVPLPERGGGPGRVLFEKKGIAVTEPLSEMTGTGASVVLEREGGGPRELLSATAGNGVRAVVFEIGRGVADAAARKPSTTNLGDSIVSWRGSQPCCS